MQGSSKVIMGATLVMAVSLTVVFGLVLVLLAELYCSLLLRRRKLRKDRNTTNDPSTQPSHSPDPSPAQLSSFYAQGVLAAPRSFLLPPVAGKPDNARTEDQQSHHQQHQVLEVQIQEPKTSPRQIGILSPPSSFLTSPHPVHVQVATGGQGATNASPPAGCSEHFVYISNPMFDGTSRACTPFQTPDTSPSRLESGGSSGDENNPTTTSPATPPLSPMKKLPAEACSVSLRDARSIGTSGSDSNSCKNGQSSSSSGSPCTSPSW